MTTASLRLGISRCLLGDEVRFDGGHKRDSFLTDVFGRYVEWVSVCPEVEAGLGTPREAMRLVGDPQNPRLLTIKSGTDHTRALETLTTNRIAQLMELDLSGYVFKKGSPSCGIELNSKEILLIEQGFIDLPHQCDAQLIIEKNEDE